MNRDPEFSLYLTRTFTILGTSLWEYWYRSKQFKDIAGFSFSAGVFVGTPVNSGKSTKDEYLVRHYRYTKELDFMRARLERVVLEEPAHALELLESAWGIYEAEISMQEKSKDIPLEQLRNNLQFEYANIEEVFDMHVNIGIYTALLPYLWIGKSNPDHAEHARIEELCQKLRATTLYPLFFEQVILPYLEGKTGLSRRELNYLTWNEIVALSHEVDSSVYLQEVVKKRIERSKREGTILDFVYRVEGEAVSLEFVSEAESNKVLESIDTRFVSAGEETRGGTSKEPVVLKGVVVSKGDGKPVTGIARVVTGTDISGIEFNEGDILVTINSSPIYLPLIRKAGALLSEEGGMACHTAIVAREGKELNKPTLMGITHLLTYLKHAIPITIDPTTATITLHL